jgi:hypothetical protein
MSDKDTCRSCGADIWWAITAKKKRMPVDPPGTHPEPNVPVWRDTLTGILYATAEPRPGMPVTPTTSHFATCPNAARHRRKRS